MIPDPIERLEVWEDRMCHDLGLPDGRVRCAGCSEPIEVGKCRQIGASPYGVPVCERCFAESHL